MTCDRGPRPKPSTWPFSIPLLGTLDPTKLPLPTLPVVENHSRSSGVKTRDEERVFSRLHISSLSCFPDHDIACICPLRYCWLSGNRATSWHARYRAFFRIPPSIIFPIPKALHPRTHPPFPGRSISTHLHLLLLPAVLCSAAIGLTPHDGPATLEVHLWEAGGRLAGRPAAGAGAKCRRRTGEACARARSGRTKAAAARNAGGAGAAAAQMQGLRETCRRSGRASNRCAKRAGRVGAQAAAARNAGGACSCERSRKQRLRETQAERARVQRCAIRRRSGRACSGALYAGGGAQAAAASGRASNRCAKGRARKQQLRETQAEPACSCKRSRKQQPQAAAAACTPAPLEARSSCERVHRQRLRAGAHAAAARNAGGAGVRAAAARNVQAEPARKQARRQARRQRLRYTQAERARNQQLRAGAQPAAARNVGGAGARAAVRKQAKAARNVQPARMQRLRETQAERACGQLCKTQAAG